MNTLRSTFGALAAGLVLASGCDPFAAYEDHKMQIRAQKAETTPQQQFEIDFIKNYSITSTNGSTKPFQSALGKTISNKNTKYKVYLDGPIELTDDTNWIKTREPMIFDDNGYLFKEDSRLFDDKYTIRDASSKEICKFRVLGLTK